MTGIAMRMKEHIRRQNRFMPHIFGLSKRNVEIARAINKRKDAGAQRRPGPWHRADVDHGPFSILKSFRQFGIIGVKNDIQHELDDFRSDLGRPNKTKVQTIIERRKIARTRWRHLIYGWQS